MKSTLPKSTSDSFKVLTKQPIAHGISGNKEGTLPRRMNCYLINKQSKRKQNPNSTVPKKEIKH